jgi:hypothetical protein
MTTQSELYNFSTEDMKDFEPTMKIGMLATITPEGLPHLTLISSLMASTPTQLVWGQFTEGVSKSYIRQNPNIAFLIMNMQKEVWRGKAAFTHSQNDGKNYDFYNNTPMFRYNAYFGIHTVYYMDLLHQSGKHPLPMGKVVSASIKTLGLKPFTGKTNPQNVINSWTADLISKLGNLKFLSYIGSDDYPIIIPIFQAAVNNSEEILFSTSAYREDLEAIPAGTPMALFGMTLDMEDVLLRGEYTGLQSFMGMKYGKLNVDWVYNAMPPLPQQIYPPRTPQTVLEF